MTRAKRGPAVAVDGSCYEDLVPLLTHEADQYLGAFRGLTLASAFQPIFSLTHRRAVGYEGLLRARRKSTSLSPLRVFAAVESESEAVRLDRLCRLLHLRNFAPQDRGDGWLFLNVNVSAVSCEERFGPFFGEALRSSGILPQRVVIEILESAAQDRGRLSELIQYYRALGCLIAIDDFGAGHSNFDRVWNLQPDLVKVDRSILVNAGRDRRVQRMLPGLVSLLHEAGSLVVLEGIETEHEAMIAVDSDADFVQGYLFGHPAATLDLEPAHPLLATLCERFRHFLQQESTDQKAYLAGLQYSFTRALQGLAEGVDPSRALRELLHHPKVLRCYVLDEQGNQIGSNYLSVTQALNQDARFAPLANVSSANWSRRPYFRRALSHPDTIQITRPYFSVTDARLALTLSQTYSLYGQLSLLCCDAEPTDL